MKHSQTKVADLLFTGRLYIKVTISLDRGFILLLAAVFGQLISPLSHLFHHLFIYLLLTLF